MKRNRRTEIVSTHLEPELKAALAELAERDGRTVSNKLRELTVRAVRTEQSQSERSPAA
jgi:hypothetical protein